MTPLCLPLFLRSRTCLSLTHFHHERSIQRAYSSTSRSRFISTSSVPTSRAIPSIPAPSLSHFHDHVLLSDTPHLLTDALTDWRALTRWSSVDKMTNSMLSAHAQAPNLVVPVEVSKIHSGEEAGRGYNSKSCEVVEMPLGVFFEAFMMREQTEYVGYLAQFGLLDAISELKEDVSPPLAYTQSGRGDEWRTNVWIGTPGTFTPIHRDPYHNLFCQIMGKKHVRIFPPSSKEKLYLSQNDPLRRNTSTIEVPSPDPEHHPLFVEALVNSWECTVEPGQVLFIPKGFYHSVRGVTKSVSVNSWFL